MLHPFSEPMSGEEGGMFNWSPRSAEDFETLCPCLVWRPGTWVAIDEPNMEILTEETTIDVVNSG